MAESSKFHPAIIVTNIKNTIPVTLDMDTTKYLSWVTLFKTHCKAYQVLDHIIPETPATTDSSSTISPSVTPQPANKETWDRLDAIVLQWIYGTISLDMLENILKPEQTAQEAWDRIKSIFEDNKNSRAVHLRHKFANIRLDNFSNISDYCKEVKLLAYQLANVGPALEPDHIVLQLITGLNENYDQVGSQLSHTNPLPSFYEARSTLILEESRKQQQAANTTPPTTDTALATQTSPIQSHTGTSRSSISSYKGRGRGSYRGNNRGRHQNNRGRGSVNYPRPNSGNVINGLQSPNWAFNPWTGQPTN
ncbi:uncharacterized protein [Rutidosis leptorrhynchoides]|uniref:uncharacterized protein n=1 Tax=Rutidosis leptorrhynchoides TaxID=125765 RepID=UPI003A99D5B4